MNRLKEKKQYSPSANFPYLIGVYLAINVIPDAYIIVDAPDCSFYKAEVIHGNHDWNSSLIDCSLGFNRIISTSANIDSIIVNRKKQIEELIKRVEHNKSVGVIFICSMPMCSITGIQYDNIIKELGGSLKKKVIEIPSKSLLGDWLNGYSETLNVISTNIDLSNGNPKPENIAIVGYLMDRAEGDHYANIKELYKIADCLNLNLVSIWLSNQTYDSLSNIKDAGTIISLPYARKAAKNIAQRTGANIIEVDVPFGIKGTKNFILKIANFFGKKKEAMKFIDEELKYILPKIKWVVSGIILNKNIGFIGEPYILKGFSELSEELGFKILFAVLTSMKKDFTTKTFFQLENSIYEPTLNELRERIIKIKKSNEIDLVVSNTFCIDTVLVDEKIPFMEFGFPSFYTHVLNENPFLCFRGCLSFISEMANKLRLFELLKSKRIF